MRASLGCGNPVAVAELQPGETVLDLGSGGGIDVLLSARRVSPGGTAYGLDGSSDMIVLARENAAQAGVTNAEFLHGHIEDIPLPDGHVDVVISNCVINLSADKPRVLAETFRVVRPGGRLGISDVIADEGLDPAQRAEAEQRTGCTTGTLTAAEYRGQLLASGFTSIYITAIQDTEPGLRSAIIQAVRPPAPPGTLIRPMRAGDADQVLAIYQAGLDTGDASFETAVPAWDAFHQARLPLHRHVAISVSGEVLGWVAASAVSPRTVYHGVIEHSVYVHPGAQGGGIGGALLAALTGSADAAGIWTVQTGIFPENTASLRLHQRAGSALSVPGSASAPTTAAGATSTSWNAAVSSRGPDPPPRRRAAHDALAGLDFPDVDDCRGRRRPDRWFAAGSIARWTGRWAALPRARPA